MLDPNVITDIDNRGTEERPWGFVYFRNREAATFGVGDDNAWAVTDGGPNWPTLPSEAQLAAALAHLEQHGPRMPVAAAC